MKTNIYFLALFAIIGGIVLTGCGNKKMQASKARIEQLKQDSIETHRKLNEKNNSATVKKSTTPVKKAESYTPVPPNEVEKVFKTKYPAAKEVSWSKEDLAVINKVQGYKVNFELDNSRNSVIYSEKGELIELREQILPDQLPPNIYAAIKTKYPGVQIIYAANYKSRKINGAYSALIKPETNVEEIIEVILTEDGTFVKN